MSAMPLHDPLIDLQDLTLRRLYGKYPGTVTDNQDPDNRARVKVSCPSVLGTEQLWALPCVPYAGPQVGFYFIPPVGAEVWVEFAAGDVSLPIWVGCYWGPGQLPPDASGPDVKVLATAQNKLVMDDTSGAAQVIVSNQTGTTTWGQEVSTECQGATHTVGSGGVVSESSPGKVEVGAAGVTINNGAFKVS